MFDYSIVPSLVTKNPAGHRRANTLLRATSQIAVTAGFLISRSTEIAKSLSDVAGATDQLEPVALPELLLHHVRCRDQPERFRTQHGSKREVVKLRDDLGTNVVGPEPVIECAAKCRVAAR